MISAMSPGDVLARSYVLEARLGEGGMGEVWRAKRAADGVAVAVKVLRGDLAADEGARKRFLREARAAMAVRHPNVVAMLDVHEDADTPFLVMELLAGETLGKRLRRKGALGVAETAAVLLPVFDAVEAAHAAGIVHRDLKPENIFLAREAGGVRVCVLDFGIAKRVEKLTQPLGADAGETTATAATTGSMVGTPYYMAPEQALGERDVDGRADLWSLGIILYECLSGRRPTEASTLGGVLKILVTGAIPPLAEVVPALDPDLADEVMDLLRADRETRATSLGALRTSLEALGTREIVLDLPAEVPSEPPPSLTRSTIVRRSAKRWIALGAALVAGVAALGLSLSPRAAPQVVEPAPIAPNAATTASLPAPVPTDTPPRAEASASASPAATTGAPGPVPHTTSNTRLAAAKVPEKPAASATPSGAPSRGPSGLVTDNPFPR